VGFERNFVRQSGSSSSLISSLLRSHVTLIRFKRRLIKYLCSQPFLISSTKINGLICSGRHHKSDGLIFAPNLPYHRGTDFNYMKVASLDLKPEQHDHY